MQTYAWFEQVPEHLRTRRQLRERGLRPGGPVIARVVWRDGERHADLFDSAAAQPKRVMTDAQRAALAKAQQARRTCPGCGTVLPFVLPARWRCVPDCAVCCGRMVAADRAAAVCTATRWLASPRTIILDTETTDLDGYLVQIAVIDTAGMVLLDTRVKAQHPISDAAQAVHGISAAQLVDAPTFAQLAPVLWPLLHGKRIVTYNAAFDSGILENEVERCITRARLTPPLPGWRSEDRDLARRWVGRLRWKCAMELNAAYRGDWHEYYQNYRWPALLGGDHSALGDARATLAVLEHMAADAEGQRV